MNSIKDQLFQAGEDFIKKKITSAQAGIDELQESANMETKSSVGDKYETNRAMIHIEREKYSRQLEESQKMQKVLAQINRDKKHENVDLGSLVITNLGRYYLSIAAGKIKIDGDDYFLISRASPIGQQLTSKTKGDAFTFNGRKYEVIKVM